MIEHMNEFLESLRARGYAHLTIREKKAHIYKFVAYLAGKNVHDLCAVTPSVIENYKKYRLNAVHPYTKQKVSLNTMLDHFYTLKRYFVFLCKHKYVLINPLDCIELPKREFTLPRNILTEKEMSDLLDKPDISTEIGLRDRAIMELLYSTGIRSRELINLDLYDMDFIATNIRVNQGKNKKDRIIPTGKTALKYVERYINKVSSKSPLAGIQHTALVSNG